MAQGINSDLSDITYYTTSTPVHYSTSNVPLADLNTNVLLLDQKLEGYIQSGATPFAGAGDGTVPIPVVFTTTMNTVPRIVTGMDNLTGTGANTLFAYVSSVTTAGFTLNVVGAGTAGAWTVDIPWIADGR